MAMIRKHRTTSVSGYPLPLKINSRRKTLLSGKDVVEKYPEMQKEISYFRAILEQQRC